MMIDDRDIQRVAERVAGMLAAGEVKIPASSVQLGVERLTPDDVQREAALSGIRAVNAHRRGEWVTMPRPYDVVAWPAPGALV